MPLSTFPASGFDQPALLAGLLGSFWSDIYGADGELNAALRGMGSVYRQLARSFNEVAESVRYDRVPLAHVEEWTPITVTTTAANGAAFAVPTYSASTTATYGNAGSYGVATALSQFPVPLAPADNVLMLCDTIIDPAVVLVAGIDFRVDPINQVAWVVQNPFTNPGLAPTQLFDSDGNPAGQSLVLWAWRTQTDQQLLQARIGYALGATFPSTEPARELVVALVDALVNGTSELTLRRALSALYAVPMVKGPCETVVEIAYDNDGLFIATDQHVYRYLAAATPLVTIGQVVLAGDPLVDTVRFASFNAGAFPSDLQALALGPAALGSCYTQGLVFADTNTPVDAAPAPM